MHRLKLLLFLVLFCSPSLLTSFTQKEKVSAIQWVLLKGGSLQVNGSTNINKFNCEITGYNNADTLTLLNRAGEKSVVSLQGQLSLDVKLFDCHHAVMTADLRKTLKEKQFPKLKITFLTLSKMPSLTSQKETIRGLVNIELSGVTRRFDVNYTVIKGTGNVIQLIGERDVLFSDFNLTPPRKLGGMIQTDNTLKVRFKLDLKALT